MYAFYRQHICAVVLYVYMFRIDVTPKYADKIAMTAKEMSTRADIQRRGTILAWIVIMSVYDADTIAEVKLLISPFLR